VSADRIETVGVIGTGIMGRGISELLSMKGVACFLWGRSEDSVHAARVAVEASMSLAVRRKQIAAEAAEQARSLVRGTSALADLVGCDLVIETVTEDLEVKRRVLADLVAAGAGERLACTNTSALRVSEVGAAWPHADRFFGLHFMNPAPASRLVELVRAPATAPAAITQARALCERLGLQVVEAGDVNGFMVNRLRVRLINESARLLGEGVARPQDLDKAMRLALGHPMGPVSLAAFIGLDTVQKELETLAQAFGDRYAPAEAIRALVQAGNLGRKTGRGMLRLRASD